MVEFLQKILRNLQDLLKIYLEFVWKIEHALKDILDRVSPEIRILLYGLAVLGIIGLVMLVLYIIRFFIWIKVKSNSQLSYEMYNKKYKFFLLRKYQDHFHGRDKEYKSKGIVKVFAMLYRGLRFLFDILIFTVLHLINLGFKVLHLFRIRFNPEQTIVEPVKVESGVVDNKEFMRLINNYAKILKENEELRLNNFSSITKEKDDQIDKLQKDINQYTESMKFLEEKTKDQVDKKQKEFIQFVIKVLNDGSQAKVKELVKPLFDQYNLELIEPQVMDPYQPSFMDVENEEITSDQSLDQKVKEVLLKGIQNLDKKEVCQKAIVVLYKYEEPKEDPVRKEQPQEETSEESKEVVLEVPEETKVEEVQTEEPMDLEETKEDESQEENNEVVEDESQESTEAIEETQKLVEDLEPQDEVKEEENTLEHQEADETQDEALEQIIEPEEIEVSNEEEVIEVRPEEEMIDLPQENIEETNPELVDDIDSSQVNAENLQEENEDPKEDEEVEDLIQQELNKWMKDNS